MSSMAPAPTELSRTIQGSNEGVYPGFTSRAPRRSLANLPPNEDEEPIQQPTTTANDQFIPEHSLFRNTLSRGIDHRLAFGDTTRAVAQPSFGCIPTSPWGAVGTPVLMGDQCDITFERVFDVATDPAVRHMRIHTDADNLIVANAEEGKPYITVVDVQQAVIQWMKETRDRNGINNRTRRFSRWVRMVDDDGTEVEAEIWVWKGLSALSMDMANWQLHLCDA